jgi:hypothetical protein
MAVAPTTNTQGAADDHVDAPELRLFVMGLFFTFGGITSLNDVIIPKLKELFTLPPRRRCWCSSASSPPICWLACPPPRW